MPRTAAEQPPHGADTDAAAPLIAAVQSARHMAVPDAAPRERAVAGAVCVVCVHVKPALCGDCPSLNWGGAYPTRCTVTCFWGMCCCQRSYLRALAHRAAAVGVSAVCARSAATLAAPAHGGDAGAARPPSATLSSGANTSARTAAAPAVAAAPAAAAPRAAVLDPNVFHLSLVRMTPDTRQAVTAAVAAAAGRVHAKGPGMPERVTAVAEAGRIVSLVQERDTSICSVIEGARQTESAGHILCGPASFFVDIFLTACLGRYLRAAEKKGVTAYNTELAFLPSLSFRCARPATTCAFRLPRHSLCLAWLMRHVPLSA